jgi:Zn-finger nucleic acid-binding protein
MTNIAGQTRDESASLTCPKCTSPMEKVTYAGVEVDRCVKCKGLWFDAREQERLKDVKGADAIDNGPARTAATASTEPAPLECPVCHTRLIRMVDHEQPHIHFESCTVCYGVFFDAGEFRDYKEQTLGESIGRLFGGRR